MQRVTISVPAQTYDAVIENGLIHHTGELLRSMLGSQRKLFVVTVEPVRRKWGRKLMASLTTAGFAANIMEMENGERYKRLATVEALAEKSVSLGAERSAVFLALGGGDAPLGVLRG